MSFEKQAIRAATSVSATLPYDLVRFLKGPRVGRRKEEDQWSIPVMDYAR